MIEIIGDLSAEQMSLDSIVARIDAASWYEQTPAVGWNISDQIGHLTFFDERATMAITDAAVFASELAGAIRDIDAYMEDHLAAARVSTPSELLAAWRAGRHDLTSALMTLGPKDRVPWYGPDMSARTFATARLMEVWAHGQDIVDTLGVVREPTARLRHIALLGVRTMGWSFVVNGLVTPTDTVYVELSGSDDATWSWGDTSSGDSVSGSAEDFCLVITQRRNVADTGLDIVGETAEGWMQIAQAFAGPPGTGRKPLG